MQEEDNFSRISDEKLLIFTQCLDEFARLTDKNFPAQEKQKYENRINSNAVKIILLAYGIFDENMKNNLNRIDIELDDYPKECKEIIDIFNQERIVYHRLPDSEESYEGFDEAKNIVKAKFKEIRAGNSDIEKVQEMLKNYRLWDMTIDNKLKFSDFSFKNNLQFCKFILKKYSGNLEELSDDEFNKKQLEIKLEFLAEIKLKCPIDTAKEIIGKYNLWDVTIDNKLKFSEFYFENKLSFCKFISEKYYKDLMECSNNDLDKKNYKLN